jgi:predicted Fe-Mo cluster-binding NifX family protein
LPFLLLPSSFYCFITSRLHPFVSVYGMKNVVKIKTMKAALTISRDRLMAPVFAGVDLWIPAVGDEDGEESQLISTRGWHPLAWGSELKRRGVDVLICGGIDLATYSALEGHGIRVIPEAAGSAPDVFDAWRRGRLSAPEEWPPNPAGYAEFVGGRSRGCGRVGRDGFGRGRGRGGQRGGGRGRRFMD